MKAAQITKYAKEPEIEVNDIPISEIKDDEVLIEVKYAAINPLELLIAKGNVKLIENYQFPLTIGNEISGVISQVGKNVMNFKIGDAVYSRLPIDQIGGVAEYAAVPAKDIWFIPNNLELRQAVAVPLTGLTAFQGLQEELKVHGGESIFIPGGSGSFGQMAIPIAKSLGMKVIVSGNAEAKERVLAAGADQYLDYRSENYWELLSDVDYVIDTLGAKEFERELSIIKPGGKILSLITSPNKQFSIDRHDPAWKRMLFSLVGRKYDRMAQKHGVEYRFIFVRADGTQLKEITKIVEDNQIVPVIDPHKFTINDTQSALDLVAHGRIQGKVVIEL